METMESTQPGSIKLWKMLVFLIGLIVLLFASSMILCGINNECRNHIPTMANMLNSTFSTPFLVSGLNAALGLHFITVLGLHQLTEPKAHYWSILQVFFAILIYASVVITLFVFPFTGWPSNWANVAIIVTFSLWELLVIMSLYRSRKQQYIRWYLSMFCFYAACSLCYIVLRAVPNLSIVPRDDGILVVEIVSGLAVLGFFSICIAQISSATIEIHAK